MATIIIDNMLFFNRARAMATQSDSGLPPAPRRGFFRPVWNFLHRWQEGRAIRAIERETEVEIFCEGSRDTGRIDVLRVNGKRASWELVPTIAVLRHLRLVCLTHGCDSLPRCFGSMRHLQALFLRECNNFQLQTLKSDHLIMLSIEYSTISEAGMLELLYSILPDQLPNLKVLRLASVGLKTFRQMLLPPGETNDRDLELVRVKCYGCDAMLSETFQRRTLKISCDASMLDKPESETAAIAFLRAFKMPSIELEFFRNAVEGLPAPTPYAYEYLNKIYFAWQLNYSGVTMLLASLDSKSTYHNTIPLSVWPMVLGKRQRKRESRKEKRLTHEDAVFHLLRSYPELVSGDKKKVQPYRMDSDSIR